jgi:hypothetical protein
MEFLFDNILSFYTGAKKKKDILCCFFSEFPASGHACIGGI